jgi:threonyl-tRNA synthetase
VSCPGHIQIFNHRVRSLRDRPLRFSEFGACRRNDASGALHGLIRTHAFVQDDAHVFCRGDHIESEGARFCALLRRRGLASRRSRACGGRTGPPGSISRPMPSALPRC